MVSGFCEYTLNLQGDQNWHGKLRSIELRILPASLPTQIDIKRIWLETK